MRDNFSPTVKELLAKRVGWKCSNPECRASTSGPGEQKGNAINIGVAAHITAASKGGPRYDSKMSTEERASFDNGIWLCYNCSKKIDSDEKKYTIQVLKKWKEDSENSAEQELGKPQVERNQKNNLENISNEQYIVRPDYKKSKRKSHRILCTLHSLQLSGNVKEIIELINKALSAEEHENQPDEKTLLYIKYLLVHYLLADKENVGLALNIIDGILHIEYIKKDRNFYSEVLLEKVKALTFDGKIMQARSILNLIDQDQREKSAYWENAGRLALYEGKTEQSVEMFNKGLNNALKEYSLATDEDEKRTSYQHYYAFLTMLGDTFQSIQRPDKALALWKKAVNAINELNMQESCAFSLLSYAKCLLQYEKWEDTLKYLEKAYDIKKDEDDYRFFWQYYNLKAAVYLYRNNQKLNDVQNAIDSLYELLRHELSAKDVINVLRNIAAIQAEHGSKEMALNTLKAADEIIEKTGEIVCKEKVNTQRKDISRSSVFFDNSIRYTVLVPTLDDLDTMFEQYSLSENALERLHIAFNLGMGYVDIDEDRAFDWLSITIELAQSVWNNAIESRALILQAGILFGRATEEDEKKAGILIDKALELMLNIPIWDIRARIVMFKGLYEAHRENFKVAHKYFEEAKQITEAHKVNDQYLKDCISDFIDECESILSKKEFTDLDFSTIIDELNFMNTWFPKYRNEMMQFLWYNRHEDIEKLVVSSHGSKAFMFSDYENEIQEWSEGLGALFDIMSFCSISDYHTEENWNFAKMLPVPNNMNSNFFNIHCVLDI